MQTLVELFPQLIAGTQLSSGSITVEDVPAATEQHSQ
jgi:hypothetical protein